MPGGDVAGLLEFTGESCRREMPLRVSAPDVLFVRAHLNLFASRVARWRRRWSVLGGDSENVLVCMN